MKRLLLATLAVALLLPGSVAHAVGQSNARLTDNQLLLVSQNCTAVQGALGRIAQSDKLARFSMIWQYEAIGANLMTPLNSRVAALNRPEGVKLQQTAVEYHKQLDVFRNIYDQYLQQRDKITTMDCRKDTANFYDGIQQARSDRQGVHDVVFELNRLVRLYREQVRELRDSLHSEEKG